MKAKQTKIIFLTVIIAIMVIASISIITIRLLSNTAKNAIAIPNDPIYIESWKQAIPVLEKKLNISPINIVTYDDPAQIKRILQNAQKNELIIAEVPVSYQYDFQNLIEQDLSTPVKIAKLPSRIIPGAFITATNMAKYWYRIIPTELIAGIFEASDFIQYLPFTFDPINLYQSSKQSQTIETAKPYCAMPGNTINEALFAYSFAVYLTGNQEIATDILAKLETDKLFQKNAGTYGTYDAKQLLIDGKAKYAFLPLSQIYDENDKSLNICFDSDFANIPQKTTSLIRRPLIANETAIIIPSKREYKDEQIQNLISAFYSKEVFEKIVTVRHTIPSLSGFAVSDFKGEAARIYAFSATEYLLPLLRPSNYSEAKQIATDVKVALTNFE